MLLPSSSLIPHDVCSIRAAEFHKRTTVDLYVAQSNRKGKTWTLHDGPPYANGPIHMGHALNKIMKDIINRWKVLNGFKVNFKAGFDCHGLPIEKRALEDAGLKIGEADPTLVRQLARSTAEKFIALQSEQFDQLGIMTDWSQSYRTMDKKYEIQQLEVFADMLRSGLIYRQKRPVYYSPSSKTALAEAELQYKDMKCNSIWVSMPIISDAEMFADVSFLIWTTTPWTLPSNQAIAVNISCEYVIVKDIDCGKKYVMSLASYHRGISGINLARTNHDPILGQELLGIQYRPPFDKSDWKYTVINGYHVSDTLGTGMVHTAPAHGKDDYLAVPSWDKLFDYVDDNGNFKPSAPEELRGLSVLGKGNTTVIEVLRKSNHLVSEENITHSVPVDWRTGKRVVTRATAQWFADISPLMPDVIQSLKNVNFIPESAQSTLQSMLVDRREWCISRQRVWGVPIPIIFLGNDPILEPDVIQHTMSILKIHGVDSWWTLPPLDFLPERYISQKAILSKSQDTMDVWFDSGSSWKTLQAGVADLYFEGSDQHRGWFQSSLLTSIASSGTAPYNNLFTHAFVLDAKGRKMSKSLGNIISPSQVIASTEKQSILPDSLRLWIAMQDCTSNVRVSEEHLRRAQSNLQKIKNKFRWLLGNIKSVLDSDISHQKPSRLIDVWMLKSLRKLEDDCQILFDSFKINQVVEQVLNFQNNEFSAIYAPIVKDTLYADSIKHHRRLESLFVCREMIHVFLRLLSPIVPHQAEEVWSELVETETSESFFLINRTSSVSDAFSEEKIARFKSFDNMRLAILQLGNRRDLHSDFSKPQRLSLKIHSLSLQNRQLLLENKQQLLEILGVSEIEVTDCLSTAGSDEAGLRTDEHIEVFSLCEDGTKQTDKDTETQYTVHAKISEKSVCPRCRNSRADHDSLCHRCEEVLGLI